MSYIILIIIFVVITRVLIRKTFYWETIIKYLWKQIYRISDLMAAEIHAGSNETLYVERYKKSLGLRGNIINAIIDYVNGIDGQDKDEDMEENTFGYGRYNFNTILMLAKSRPDTFKKSK